jgi:hypothetical protein
MSDNSRHNVSWIVVYSWKEISGIDHGKLAKNTVLPEQTRQASKPSFFFPQNWVMSYPFVVTGFRHLLLGRVQDRQCWDCEQVEIYVSKGRAASLLD